MYQPIIWHQVNSTVGGTIVEFELGRVPPGEVWELQSYGASHAIGETITFYLNVIRMGVVVAILWNETFATESSIAGQLFAVLGEGERLMLGFIAPTLSGDVGVRIQAKRRLLVDGKVEG